MNVAPAQADKKPIGCPTHTHTHKYKKNNLPKKEKKTTPDQHPSSTHLRSIIALGLSAVETHSNLRFAPLEQGHFPCHLLPLFVCVCVCVSVSVRMPRPTPARRPPGARQEPQHSSILIPCSSISLQWCPQVAPPPTLPLITVTRSYNGHFSSFFLFSSSSSSFTFSFEAFCFLSSHFPRVDGSSVSFIFILHPSLPPPVPS